MPKRSDPPQSEISVKKLSHLLGVKPAFLLNYYYSKCTLPVPHKLECGLMGWNCEQLVEHYRKKEHLWIEFHRNATESARKHGIVNLGLVNLIEMLAIGAATKVSSSNCGSTGETKVVSLDVSSMPAGTSLDEYRVGAELAAERYRRALMIELEKYSNA